MQSPKVSTFLDQLPLFVSVFLRKESMRKLTFSVDWPHGEEVVCVDDLAQAGLFYTGCSDNVACIYCETIIHKWVPGDVPILDHCKFSPSCLFLRNPKACLNDPDIRGEDALKNLLSTLPEIGVDEIDIADYSRVGE